MTSSLEVYCSKSHRLMTTADRVGKKVKCPTCGEIFVVTGRSMHAAQVQEPVILKPVNPRAEKSKLKSSSAKLETSHPQPESQAKHSPQPQTKPSSPDPTIMAVPEGLTTQNSDHSQEVKDLRKARHSAPQSPTSLPVNQTLVTTATHAKTSASPPTNTSPTKGRTTIYRLLAAGIGTMLGASLGFIILIVSWLAR